MEPIITMPMLFGEQLYPGGFPLPKGKICVNGVTIHDIFLRFVNTPNKEDENFLLDYVKYFVNAPVFDLPSKVRKQMNEADSLDGLFDLCLYLGIDPI